MTSQIAPPQPPSNPARSAPPRPHHAWLVAAVAFLALDPDRPPARGPRLVVGEHHVGRVHRPGAVRVDLAVHGSADGPLFSASHLGVEVEMRAGGVVPAVRACQ